MFRQEKFWTEYVEKMRPLVLRGVMKVSIADPHLQYNHLVCVDKDAPATKLWTAEYLKQVKKRECCRELKHSPAKCKCSITVTPL